MRRALLVLVVAACTNNSGGGGGDDVTTHVIQFDFAATMNSACLEQALADVDPNTPGPQYECSVSDFTNYGQANQVETLLPACNNLAAPDQSTNRPCWAIVSEPSCPAPDHVTMVIERSLAAPANGHVVAQCVAQGA